MVLLEEMKAHYDDGFTSSERSTIENLYSFVCRKPIRRSGCSDCYRDAYIELTTKLKRLGKMPKTPLYVLKAGALLHEFGSSDFYTLDNIPEDFAEKWLSKNPKDIVLFETYPSDWKERAEARVNGTASADSANDKVFAAETGSNVEQERPRRGRPSTK